jgi:transcriptional regulator NrdR family protein
MECPSCGKPDSEVIDSRLSKDAMTIRRRRQCLACSERFTTYEATEEQLVPVLLRQKAGRETIATRLKNLISFNSMTFKLLAEGIGSLIEQMDKLAKPQAIKESKAKPARSKPKSLEKGPVKKAPVIKKAVKAKPVKKTTAKKPANLSASDTVLAIIKRSRKGIDTVDLRKKTGFQGRKIGDIIYRLKKQGKIKRDRKGLYVKV